MDSVLITLPNDFYKFLQAMAVVQDYSIQLATGAQRGQRDGNYQITFRLDEKYEYFERCLRVVQNNIPIFDYSGWDEEQRDEYDCFIRFNDDMFQRAEGFSKVMGAHVVAGLNTIVGAGAPPIPVVAPLQLKQNPTLVTDVLILDWNNIESEKLHEYIFNNYPQLNIILDSRDYSQYKPAELFEYINQFNVVIGPSGIATYIAVILKKVVLEIYKTNEEGLLYGFQGYPKYSAVVGQRTSAAFLWTQWEEKLWPEYSRDMKFQGEQTQSGIPESIADCAGVKSGDNQIHKSEA